MTRALEGLRVLDLTMNLPGPYMTWLLAGLGADVVKVENPKGGDYARALGGADGQSSPFFAAVNRNKRSLTLNLKNPEGRELLLRLLDHYDVLVEGFRPGAMEGFNLDFQTMSARQPRLIQVSISGYGQDGPYRLRAGHDLNYLSLAGIIGMTGTRAGEPAIPGIQVADTAGGSLMALAGLLAAIIQRDRTGRGQFVDTSMFHGAFSLATMIFSTVATGMEKPRAGQMILNGRFPFYGVYETRDGRHMSLGAVEFKFWQNFCLAVNRPDLVSQQFGGPSVIEDVQAIFRSKTMDEWIDFLKDVDACCEPVLFLDEAADSPLIQARSMVGRGPDGRRCLASPLKLGGSPPVEDQPAPDLGQHTDEVLSGIGLGPEALIGLRQRGVI